MDLDFCDCFGTFQNNLKNLDPSNRMDLDFCDCFDTSRFLAGDAGDESRDFEGERPI